MQKQESIWDGIGNKRPIVGTTLFVSSVNNWLIGPYGKICALRDRLRTEPYKIDEFVGKYQLRFGRRSYDVFNKAIFTGTSFRKQIEAKPPETADRRLTEQYEAASLYYKFKTLEVHHIVEDNIVVKLGKDKGEFMRYFAPCVLVSAELHRRYFTPRMADFRDLEKLSKEGLLSKYDQLYSDPTMADLNDISQTIIHFIKNEN